MQSTMLLQHTLLHGHTMTKYQKKSLIVEVLLEC
jgi:hypothetical protein